MSEEASQDVEIIRTWIGQAQAFVASDKLEEIEPILRKVEAQAEYAKAKINRLAAESAAEDAEDQAKIAEDDAQKVQAAAQAAEKRMRDLESQGL